MCTRATRTWYFWYCSRHLSIITQEATHTYEMNSTLYSNFTHIRWIHNQIKCIQRQPTIINQHIIYMANHSSVKIKLHRDGRHVSLLYVCNMLSSLCSTNEWTAEDYYILYLLIFCICGTDEEFEFAKRSELLLQYKNKLK